MVDIGQGGVYDLRDRQRARRVFNMSEQRSRLSVQGYGDVSTVELGDSKILDEAVIAQLSAQLQALVADADSAKFVLDFVNVGHMSSSALGMLITLNKRVQERGGQLRLCNIRPSIYEVFVITRLNEILQIHPSRQEALASID